MSPIPASNRLLPLPGAVIKVYREAWRAETEKAALRRLADARISAPSILGSGRLFQREFLVMRRLCGSSVGRTERAAHQIITYLQAVHRITGPGFGRLSSPLAPRWNDYLRQRLVSYRDALIEHRHYGAAETADALAGTQLPEPPAPSLLHNDPEPANFLQLRGRTDTAGLDWELAVYGDPDLDYARVGHSLGIGAERLGDLLSNHGVAYHPHSLGIYRRVHLLGRLMSSVTALPPDQTSAERHLHDLNSCAR
ncbi:phosphotransferase [Dactylosporangium sp. NPDC051485]|uniref:phosphotransferase family protein n=1 Tax=Dactylosporangium sp. NPDC051485 TaxID=3154846 RepID=UPI00341AF46B